MAPPTYRERRTSLPGVVAWTRVATGHEARILPDGCTDLIWVDGRLIVAGPDTRAHVAQERPGLEYVGIRFAAGIGPSVLGTAAEELRDGRVPLAAVWGDAPAEPLVEQLFESTAPARLLESVVRERLRDRPPSRAMLEVARMFRTGTSIARVAGALGVSDRQLRRRCADAFGYGPKVLARIYRMQRAVAMAGRGLPLVEAALRAGYADQAHLAHEVRALAGVPLRALIR
jgi:AraC-like DNA-binding protein